MPVSGSTSSSRRKVPYGIRSGRGGNLASQPAPARSAVVGYLEFVACDGRAVIRRDRPGKVYPRLAVRRRAQYRRVRYAHKFAAAIAITAFATVSVAAIAITAIATIVVAGVVGGVGVVGATAAATGVVVARVVGGAGIVISAWIVVGAGIPTAPVIGALRSRALGVRPLAGTYRVMRSYLVVLLRPGRKIFVTVRSGEAAWMVIRSVQLLPSSDTSSS